MTSLYDLAVVLRSKNAGPFLITIDLMFPNRPSYERVLGVLTPERVAEAYRIQTAQVAVIPMPSITTIKVTIPRSTGSRGSGSPGDVDVYGAQQHGPLAAIAIDEGEIR